MMAKNLDGVKAKKHILKQLELHNIPNRIRSGSALITCPFHPTPHNFFPDESYLRLSINLEGHWHDKQYIPVGFCRCWSCGKVCTFNELIENKDGEIPPSKHKFFKNLKPLPKSGTAQDTSLFSKNVSLADEEEQEKFIDVPLYWRDEWKGRWRTTNKKETPIEEETLIKAGAYSFFDYNPELKSNMSGVNRLLFYTYDKNNEKIGWIALADDKARKKKYVIKQKNMDGHWVNKTFLFFEKFPKNSPVLLTEGPYDALRMMQEGFNAIAMLGASSWSKEKKIMLASKASHVVILFDGDRTGYEKSKIVYDDLKGYVPTKRLLLPIIGGDEHKELNIDPGNMPYKYVKIVRKKFNQFVENNN